jgi:hypothetical protein
MQKGSTGEPFATGQASFEYHRHESRIRAGERGAVLLVIGQRVANPRRDDIGAGPLYSITTDRVTLTPVHSLPWFVSREPPRRGIILPAVAFVCQGSVPAS